VNDLNTKINRNLKIPYYHQLYENIAKSIENSQFEEGEKLAGELELCKKYGVSRITVRQALKELELNGYIIRERGRGTFVRKKIETHSLQKVSSIVDELKSKGVKTQNKIIILETAVPDERIRRVLEIGREEKILFIERLVVAYGAPLYITKAYFPLYLTGMIKRKDLAENSFTRIVTELLNLKLVHTKRILEADVPGREICRLLELKKSDKKVINYMQTFWTVNHYSGYRIIYFEEYFNPAKGKFVFEKDF